MSQKVYVHGIEETSLAVTMDGGRQNNKVFHHNGTNLIDPGLLKAVSVDAGVAPADAGPGRSPARSPTRPSIRAICWTQTVSAASSR